MKSIVVSDEGIKVVTIKKKLFGGESTTDEMIKWEEVYAINYDPFILGIGIKDEEEAGSKDVIQVEESEETRKAFDIIVEHRQNGKTKGNKFAIYKADEKGSSQTIASMNR